jgi:transposase
MPPSRCSVLSRLEKNSTWVVRTIAFVFVSKLDEISDHAWAALAPRLSGKAGDVGRAGVDNWLFLNAVLWVARHGCAWRACPRALWQARHATQTQTTLGPKRDLAALVRGRAGTRPGLSDARLHRRVGSRAGSGQPKKSRVGDEALGRSCGGSSTKIHALVDARGRMLCLLLGLGQQADCDRAAELLQAAPGAVYVLADKGYDTDKVLTAVASIGAVVVIPSKRRRRIERPLD